MSRHRNIRNLDLDDYADYEDDYYDEDDDHYEDKPAGAAKKKNVKPQQASKGTFLVSPHPTTVALAAVDSSNSTQPQSSTPPAQSKPLLQLKSLQLGRQRAVGASVTGSKPAAVNLSGLSASLSIRPQPQPTQHSKPLGFTQSSLKSEAQIKPSLSSEISPTEPGNTPPGLIITQKLFLVKQQQQQKQPSGLQVGTDNDHNLENPRHMISPLGKLLNSQSQNVQQLINLFVVDTSKFKFDTPSPEDKIKAARSSSSATSNKVSAKASTAKAAPAAAKASVHEAGGMKNNVKEVEDRLAKMDVDDDDAAFEESLETVGKAEQASGKPIVNLVIVGHVDSGKSTLMGHLLHLVGSVSDKQANKLAHESSKQGKGSFKYAWNLDSTVEERERGVTIDVAFESFETSSKIFVILDSPGHRDFVPNMIAGANKADYAVLVVDSSPGGFESGFTGGGQTKEHAILCRSLGISHVLVAVNKMDSVNWSHDRFNEIKDHLQPFLANLQFTCEFIPVSAFVGENIKERYLNCPWYNGPSLLEALDSLALIGRSIDKPFRFMINDVTGSTVSGKIDTGSVKTGDKVLLMPSRFDTVIKSVSNVSRGGRSAEAGDFVYLTLSLDPEMINTGNVLCSSKHPVGTCSKITVKLITFECKALISGISVLFHFGCINIPATLKLISLVDKQTGNVLKRNPRVLTKNSCAMCYLEFEIKICVEPFAECKEFGRFTLRQDGQTIAAGIVVDTCPP